ncbi:MAG: twin-arginine translocase TatA/TatE family subunit [Candidatus Bathyarchaeota archaeon]|nr:twin-arginine translocase TatA/TatE family subunit [Candidatus Bathyarchaeota archaeon]MDH5663560.1 twin-arginine translocase TatA/TatE family subunit [Candidatus Bathyarchaeota archaeon]
MALIGTQELILILVILIFLFGATRLKGLAKALGESIREFKKATSESPKTRKEEEEEAIIEAARKMGVETRGKSIEQILSDMNKRTAKKD